MDALAATGGCDTGAAIGDWFGLVGEENGEVEEGKRGAVYTRRARDRHLPRWSNQVEPPGSVRVVACHIAG